MIWTLLETVAGVGLLYVLLCVVVCGLNEWLAGVRGWRGNFLKAGIKRMLPDQPIYRRVMQHPLISGMYRDQTNLGRPPTYLAPANFAGALVEVIRRRAAVTGWSANQAPPAKALQSAIETITPDHPLIAQTLLPILDRAGDDYDQVLSGIEAWFESAMERVAEWYNGYARRQLFILALLSAVAANLDAIAVTRAFWAAASVPEATATTGAIATPQTPSAFSTPPVGYACLAAAPAQLERTAGHCFAAFRLSALGTDGWLRLMGWLITALAVTIGAPYLFRLLSQRAPR